MSLIVYGCSYKTSSIDKLERLSISRRSLPKALQALAAMPNVLEGAILSTCNRVEIYAKVTHFHAGVTDVKNFIGDTCGLSPEELVDSAYLFFDQTGIRHLFRVASGLESMVLGETEILGQVKSAIDDARKAGTAGRTLGRVFERAVRVGKLVRKETAISRNVASVSSAAVQLASEKLGGLSGKRVAVVGAGEAGQAAVKAFVGAGCDSVYVVNRSLGTAREIAARLGGMAAPLKDLPEVVRRVDILVTSTRAEGLLIQYEDVEAFARRRSGLPLLIVDIALPRDVDPAAREIEGVELLDIEDLEAVAAEGRRIRAEEAEKAARIVDDEVETFLAELQSEDYREVIKLLKARFDSILEAELEKAGRKAGADTEKMELARRVSRSVMKKIMHFPVSRLKGAAVTDKAEVLAEALAYLFDLEDLVPPD